MRLDLHQENERYLRRADVETEDELDGIVIGKHHKLKQLNSLEAIDRGLHFKRVRMAVTHEQDKASFCSITKLWLAGI